MQSISGDVTLCCTMEVAVAPIIRLALRKSQGHRKPAGVYFSATGAQGFNAEGGNELFPAHGQRAAGSCHSEVADWNRKCRNTIKNSPATR